MATASERIQRFAHVVDRLEGAYVGRPPEEMPNLDVLRSEYLDALGEDVRERNLVSLLGGMVFTALYREEAELLRTYQRVANANVGAIWDAETQRFKPAQEMVPGEIIDNILAGFDERELDDATALEFKVRGMVHGYVLGVDRLFDQPDDYRVGPPPAG